jgi:alkanesulfonate monooxygenase SsuD/methylene tetrahydromethanopterin reductase-like flavin-dependent oxidoreductase (luciferase family)
MKDALDEFELADQIGYDSLWVAEHFFSTYGIVGSCQVFLAAVAQRTKRARIGSAISIVPFNHPLRTASDYALVDILSNGRLEFGVGRAYQPHEFTALGVPMERSREIFDQGMRIILDAWTKKHVVADGSYWNTLDGQPVESLPKPVQQPTPPLWQSALSPPSFKLAAESGWNLLTASPFSYRMHRENWKEALGEEVRLYERTCEELGRDPKAARRAIMVPFFCAPTEDEAKETYGPYVEWFYNKVSSHEQVVGPSAGSVVPGYELHMTEGKKTKEAGMLAFEQLHRYGAAIASDPDGCVAQLKELQEIIGLTDVILWFNLGGISTEASRASMKLTMEQVVPHFSDVKTAVTS